MATISPLEVVDASLEEVAVEDRVEEVSSRRRRSSAGASRVHSLGLAYGVGSTRSVPESARSPKSPGPPSWVSTICSSMYTAVAEENERQHVINIRKSRWLVRIGR